jgi:phosphotransacetylase
MIAHPHFQRLANDARLLPPLAAGFVYPCDAESLQFALSGAFAGYLAPVLIGPLPRIRATAEAAGLDITRLAAIDTTDDRAAAARRAVVLARQGDIAAIVRGAIGNDELLPPAAAPDTGLRTDRRLSHVVVLDLPGRPGPLLVADAQLNVSPNLAAKRDIALNTLDFAATLGVRRPRLAIVSALDVVSPAFPSTADAAALKSMGAQGLLGEVVVDGPVLIDAALGGGEGGGRADIVLAPGMETAAILCRTLTAVTGAFAAGLVLGARVPILTPSRGDSLEVRIASCVLAALYAVSRRAARELQPALAPRLPAGGDAAALPATHPV